MYEWDRNKNDENLRRHGLSFEDAAAVFDGPCLTFEDRRIAYGEERCITVGYLEGRLVVIAHTQRGRNTRIISMRKANSREQRAYEKRLEADRPDEG
ncbi:MAG: BrnT family toxin [Gemmatimonadota bacterium]|nr:BrnT family toxin [Gemmatimonadota bacterium]